jgi:hypothetical protein
MPHVDHQMSLRNTWVDHGLSPFARPVAAITHFVQSLPTRAGAAVTGWSTRRHPRPDGDARLQEERYAGATDSAELEGMQRAFDRREGDSFRHWEAR